VDRREITGFSPAAPSGLGDGGCLSTGIGTGPQHCLAQGVNRTVAAARFWECWIWQEAKDVGGRGAGIMVALGQAGVMGRRGSMPCCHLEGWRTRP